MSSEPRSQATPNDLPITFDPSDSRAFRDALGLFATGVTIVTCLSGRGPLGITANSFSSLSLDPPLVMWAPAKSSSRFDSFVTAEHFAIHVLAEDQRDLCGGFARSGEAFDGLDVSEGYEGTPLIDNCLSRFECRRHAVYPGGDHAIVVGEVLRVTVEAAGVPLIFTGGQYAQITR
jgi:flavin reductase (DIM6/NTAB) family NADH-FMN oxidoreductase RutF